MALTLAECDAIIDAAQKAGVVLQIGFMRRFDPDFRLAYERIKAGEIGQPMIVKSLTHGPGLPPPWARDLKLSNGMLAEVNSHDWDSVRWLAGSNPARVFVETANFKGAARGVEDSDVLRHRHRLDPLRQRIARDDFRRLPVRLRLRRAGRDRRRKGHHADRRDAGSRACRRHRPRQGPGHADPSNLAGAVRLGLHPRDGALHRLHSPRRESRRRAEATAAGRWPACSPARSRFRRSGRCGWPRS